MKRGFEGGQQPLYKKTSKVGFFSRTVKPYSINVDKVSQIATLDEITLDSIKSVYKLSKSVEKVKLIGSTAKDLVAKIKDENVYNYWKIIMSKDLINKILITLGFIFLLQVIGIRASTWS